MGRGQNAVRRRLLKLVVCQIECHGEGVPTRISHSLFQQVATTVMHGMRDRLRQRHCCLDGTLSERWVGTKQQVDKD